MAACDSTSPSSVDPPPAPAVIEPLVEAALDINALTIRVNNRGEITSGRWLTPTGENFGTIFRTGLWVSAIQEGETRTALVYIGDGILGPSAFTSEREGGPFGTYFLERDAEVENPEAWPVSEGAPVNNDGSPRVYGDAMVWTSMTVETGAEGTVYERPIEGLRVNQSVFAYDNATEPDVVFVRYELLNTTSQTLTDVAIGHWGDFDLDPDLHVNSTGFDLDTGTSFTYLSDTAGNNGTAPLIAVAFLNRPAESPLLSHRIMRKGNFRDPDFGEFGFVTPEQVALALRGLSNTGQPMVNPETGQETLFAFTGNPATMTGWLDVSFDVRSLLSVGPLTLAPGEEISFTLALVAVQGPTIGEALTDLRARVQALQATPSIWQFD